ncbi:MAG: hypothetical protein A2051_00725 [Desulfovibrionales bacterium GWA2_65_9]|nr:MAG: hypothetical protein A2051_00725 [Desulfovibrionales bacterium GWA2_65_9]
MSTRTISLTARLWATAVLALIGSVALLSVSLLSINKIKIRGALYQEIVSYKDLLADILPPPVYLIESYLTSFELLKAEGAEREALFKKTSKLEADFRERGAVWAKDLTHVGIRKALLDEATPPALEYFRIMKESFLPQLRAGKEDEARKTLEGPLTAAYQKHRAGIDKTVELANKEVTVVEAKADKSLSLSVLFLYAAAVVINLLVLLLTFISIRSIMRPMSKLISYATCVSEGDYAANCDVPAQGEIGRLAEVLKTTVTAVRDSIAKAGKSEQVAQDEAQKARIATDEATEAKILAERAKVEGMIAAATHLEQVVDGISSASEQLSAQVEQSSRGTEVQSSRVAETATAMEEMNSTVLEVAKNASQAADSSHEARNKALEGASIVAQVVSGIGTIQTVSLAMREDMGMLGKQAEGIGAIMNVISDIADQTNLLALNAAIEAARAGDAGRGFAVVADEVRKLAEKTMTATKEVGDAISAVQLGTKKNLENVERAATTIEQATMLANQSGAALKEIVRLVEVSSDQVRSIATASEQQSATSEEINRSIEDINRVSSETASAMGQSAQAVGELVRQAGALRGLIEKMMTGG